MPYIIHLIEKRLEEKKMSMRELARQADIHHHTLKASDESSIKIGTLQKISKILDIPMSDFFQEDKLEISNRKKYKLAEELIQMAGGLVPEYKKILKTLPPKTSKQSKK